MGGQAVALCNSKARNGPDLYERSRPRMGQHRDRVASGCNAGLASGLLVARLLGRLAAAVDEMGNRKPRVAQQHLGSGVTNHHARLFTLHGAVAVDRIATRCHDGVMLRTSPALRRVAVAGARES